MKKAEGAWKIGTRGGKQYSYPWAKKQEGKESVRRRENAEREMEIKNAGM